METPTWGSTTAKASLINMLDFQPNQPRAKLVWRLVLLRNAYGGEWRG